MFKANGSKLEILMQLVQDFEITTKEAKMIFEYIESHSDILDENESLIRKDTITNEEDDAMNLFLSGSGYYLNVKKITIVLLATIFDCYLTKGMVSAGLTLSGIELQAIMKLKEEKLCLVKEMLLEHQKLYNESDLSRYELECINNDIQCHFNNSGICMLTKEQIATVLDDLFKKDVIEKIGNKYKVHIL